MKRKGGCIVLLCIMFVHVIAQDHKSELWNMIQPYFTPPLEFQCVYGDYRSPRLFYNGDSVRTAEDWGKRAREIRAKWMEMMGEWPPILTDQTFEIIETEKREDFTQHLVRFYWTPN
ncbi:MAG: sialidase, partial [Bacteroidota bacterium]|nr:sialidase [Bacteroidota bacterium]